MYIAYVAPRWPLSTTASNGIDMYTSLQRPAVSGVHNNSPAAASGADATTGDDGDGYKIPLPTEMAPTPLYVNTQEAIRQLQAAEQPQYEMAAATR